MAEQGEQRAEQRRVDINWVQAFAGALAATSSAVLLSTVGAAGTIIGAAVGSVVVTVGNSVYAHFLKISRERVVAASVAAREVAIRDRLSTRRPDRPAPEPTVQPEEPATQPAAWREAISGLPWKRIGVVSVGVFLLAMAVIVAFELAAGRSVSTVTGGTTGDGQRTSIPGVGASGPDKPDDTPAPTESPGTSPTDSTPTETPGETEATEEPTPDPTTQSTSEPPVTEPPPTTE